MEVTNNTGTLANDYVAHVSLKDTNNYEWADGTNTTLDLAWSISKVKVNAPTMTTTSYTFTGENVTPEVTGYDEGGLQDRRICRGSSCNQHERAGRSPGAKKGDHHWTAGC